MNYKIKKSSNVLSRILCFVAAIFLPVMAGCASAAIDKSVVAAPDDVPATESVTPPPPDISWYTRNPDTTHFEISTAAELAGLAALVNGTVKLDSNMVPRMFIQGDYDHWYYPDIFVDGPFEFYTYDQEIIDTFKHEFVFIGDINFEAVFDFEDKTITLTQDIDISSYGYGSIFNNGNGWIAIGDCSRDISRNLPDVICYNPSAFAGIFDGNGKIISGLYSVARFKGNHDGRPTYYPGGLFGYVTGTVKNVGVVDARVIGGGGIVGTLRGGEVSNIYFTGTVEIVDGWGSGAGGIVGRMYSGSISNCYFAGTVAVADTGYEERWAGGIVGMVSAGEYMAGSIVSNCYSTGTISGNSGVGGIVGRLDIDGVISNCYSTAEVNGKSSVGGIVGFVNNFDLSRKYAVFGTPNKTVLFDTLNTYVSNNIALNSSVNSLGSEVHVPTITDRCWNASRESCQEILFWYGGIDRAPDSSFSRGGRVVGGNDGGMLSNNAAFAGITNISGSSAWDNRDDTAINGADITAEAIRSDGTLGGRLTSENNWTTENGKLPGLFGQTVELPEHLR